MIVTHCDRCGARITGRSLIQVRVTWYAEVPTEEINLDYCIKCADVFDYSAELKKARAELRRGERRAA